MPRSFLNNVLDSDEPSSLDPLARLRKEREHSRLLNGSNTVRNRFNSGSAAADVITKAGYFSTTAQNSGSPPPLQGTVKPLNLPKETDFDTMAPRNATRATKDATLTVNAADYKNMEKENKKLRKEIGKLPEEHEQLKEDYDTSQERNKNLRAKVAELQEQINKMKKKRGRKGVVNRKSEQNDDVKEAIDDFVKAVLFRTVKFAQTGEQLTNATKLVWEGIKDKKKLEIGDAPLTVDDFCEIYESHVASCLSLRRQYVQTQTQKAAEEWLETHETLPTTEEIEKVWDLPEVDDSSTEEAKAEYRKKADILTWYLDIFLPKGVGLEFWGDLIRPYNFMTDTALVEGDLSGKKKVLVTVTSEAFAQLVYHNCRDKWIADHLYKKQHGKKAQVPKYVKDDVTTHAHVNKWSNSRSGSAVGGGWHRDALLKFNALKNGIKEFRSEQEGLGQPLYKYGQTLIKAANDINMNSGKLSGKKRKSPPKEAGKEVEIVDITFDDE